MTEIDTKRLRELLDKSCIAAGMPFEAFAGEVLGSDGDVLLGCYSNAAHGYEARPTADLTCAAINALPELLAVYEAVRSAEEGIEEIAHKLEDWARAYPEDLFPEPEDADLKWLHETKRGLCDRISASMGRHMVKHMAEMAGQFRRLVRSGRGGEPG